MNVLAVEEKIFRVEESDSSVANFNISTLKNYSEINVQIFFNHTNFDPQQFRLKITKTYSILLRKKKSTITSKEELRKLLYKDNSSNFPNGSLLQYNNSIYLLEKGKLRKIPSKKTFEMFGFQKNKIIPINKDTYGSFEKADNIEIESIFERKFPQNIIFRAGANHYINGANSVYPIFSEEIIENIWSNYSFIDTNGTLPREMLPLKCYIISDTQFSCNSTLSQVNHAHGNTYFLTLFGVPLDSIDYAELRFRRTKNIEEVKTETRRLLW